MKVADSSFVVEALLKRKELLEEDFLLTMDLAIYETVNSIWKHQFLLKDVKDGLPYVSILHGLMESGRIRVVQPRIELIERAYSLSAKHKRPIYDMVFVALALELSTSLATFDKGQAAILQREVT